jgi:hypothetical protein
MTLTAEDIINMTSEEYEKRRPELLKAMAEGKLVPPVDRKESGESRWLRGLRQRIANMSPEQYEQQRGSILLELNERKHNPHKFVEPEEASE